MPSPGSEGRRMLRRGQQPSLVRLRYLALAASGVLLFVIVFFGYLHDVNRKVVGVFLLYLLTVGVFSACYWTLYRRSRDHFHFLSDLTDAQKLLMEGRIVELEEQSGILDRAVSALRGSSVNPVDLGNAPADIQQALKDKSYGSLSILLLPDGEFTAVSVVRAPQAGIFSFLHVGSGSRLIGDPFSFPDYSPKIGPTHWPIMRKRLGQRLTT
jgi:hypothetical protein